MKEAKLTRVRALANSLHGDPRSVFYGDVTVQIDPEDAANAIGHQAEPQSAVEQAIVSDEPNELVAADKIAAYNALTDSERAARTLLPALATWNAMVIVNPMLGKVLSKALDYMLLKSLNDYPFEGRAVMGVYDSQTETSTVTIDSRTITGQASGQASRFIAIPFFRFTIAASTLNAAPGSQVSIDIVGTDAEGRTVDTATNGYTYSFQRLNNVEAVVGVFIPTVVVATRTLPFLPVAGDRGTQASEVSLTIKFKGVKASDSVTVVVPGYATSELKEISAMYNLPSGMIR